MVVVEEVDRHEVGAADESIIKGTRMVLTTIPNTPQVGGSQGGAGG